MSSLEAAVAEIVEKLLRERDERSATDPTNLISVERAAARLDVSKSYIRREIREGRLPYFNVGSCVRVRIADVDALAKPGRRTKKPGTRAEQILKLVKGGAR